MHVRIRVVTTSTKLFFFMNDVVVVLVAYVHINRQLSTT